MKLKHKLSLFNIISKLLLVVILWIAFPYIVKKVIYNNADKNLLEKKEKFTNNLDSKEIKDFLLTKDSTEEYVSFSTLHDEFIVLEVSPNQKKINGNVFFNDKRKIENQDSEYRILQHNFTYNKVNYQLEIGSNIKDINELIELLHYNILFTFLGVAFFTFFIDLSYISYLLKPFYKIVETKIKLINEPEKFIHIPIDNTTSEFKELDTALNQMIYRINELFLKEKQFIGNVSHELLTPISILKNRLENLIQNQSLNDNAVDKVSDSLQTLDLMKKVIANLLLISRIDNKQYQINEVIDFDKIISELIENLEDRIQEKHLVITKNILHQVHFSGNQTLIKILLSNLFTNAIKYNNYKGSIIIRDEIINHKYYLTISDSGLGMSTEQASQIFNRFSRIHFDQEGQGIGLAIVNSIAQLHQIEIQVTSEINQGTNFTLIFPYPKNLIKS
ncbi:HAMP domain-containing histidine kinase [Flavobacterium franklandianum]|uniref:sensor histidine kinase n=1 Tax=Flavobacterium franklandianum TaxID=2594430 RepID=UPI00117B20C5|nr:HAMP domain-containing sensor histidine kinase [Flavobacterium franklandianum]TRX25467.1 HAMP domain-containing histidine kinase [Flavobacterium franklandianum]